MKDYGIRLKRQGSIAVMTLDRPAKQNAFDEHMWDCLDEVVRELTASLPRVIVLTGAGEKAFCAGFDVNPETEEAVNLIASGESIHGVSAFLMRKKPEFPEPGES